MKHFGLVLAALIAVTACTSPKSSTAPSTSTGAVTTTPTTTVPPSTTTTAVAVDPSVVPAVVDLPYLTAVMARLRMLDLQQLAIVERDHRVSSEALSLFRAEYAEPELDTQLTNAAYDALKPSRNVKPQGSRGPIITTAARIVTNTPQCVSFVAMEDFSQLAEAPVPIGTDVVALRPINRSKDPQHLNPTPWQISSAVIPRDPAHPNSPENQCSG